MVEERGRAKIRQSFPARLFLVDSYIDWLLLLIHVGPGDLIGQQTNDKTVAHFQLIIHIEKGIKNCR